MKHANALAAGLATAVMGIATPSAAVAAGPTSGSTSQTSTTTATATATAGGGTASASAGGTTASASATGSGGHVSGGTTTRGTGGGVNNNNVSNSGTASPVGIVSTREPITTSPSTSGPLPAPTPPPATPVGSAVPIGGIAPATTSLPTGALTSPAGAARPAQHRVVLVTPVPKVVGHPTVLSAGAAGSLPFTGFPLIAIIVAGIAALTAGALIRWRLAAAKR